MLKPHTKLTSKWIILLLSVGWSTAVFAQVLELPYSGSVQHYGSSFEIENSYHVDPSVPSVPPDSPFPEPIDLDPLSAISGRYSYIGPWLIGTTVEPNFIEPITTDYQNIGRLGGHTFGVEGICGTKDGYGLRAENTAQGGTGLFAKSGQGGYAAVFDGSVALGETTVPENLWGCYIYDGVGFWGGGKDVYSTSCWNWNFYRKRVPYGDQICVLEVDGYRNIAGIELCDMGILLRTKESASEGDASPPTRMVIKPNGNVGVGTLSPNARLHVAGDTIISNGNVGIGTDKPSTKLDVSGDLKVHGAYRGDIGPNGGAPFPRPAYDSGWIPVKPGTHQKLIHSIGGNVDNYFVDLQLRGIGGGIGDDTDYSGINNAYIGGMRNWTDGCDTGGVWYLPNEEADGAFWHSLTAESITVHWLEPTTHGVSHTIRDYAGDVRIRIWVYN